MFLAASSAPVQIFHEQIIQVCLNFSCIFIFTKISVDFASLYALVPLILKFFEKFDIVFALCFSNSKPYFFWTMSKNQLYPKRFIAQNASFSFAGMFFSYKKACKAIENLLSCWNFSRCCAQWPKVDHWCLVAHLLCRYRAGTVQALCNYCAGTVQALCKHRVSTVQNWNPKLDTA